MSAIPGMSAEACCVHSHLEEHVAFRTVPASFAVVCFYQDYLAFLIQQKLISLKLQFLAGLVQKF